MSVQQPNHLLRSLVHEARVARQAEHAGDNAATPLLALAGLVAVLVPIFLLILGITDIAFHLAS